MSSSLSTKISDFVNALRGLIADHASITSNSSRTGHAQAGSTPQTIGDNLAAGTDNGLYARADHVHTVDYSKIKNTPSIPTASSTVPNADTIGGLIGSSDTYAKADHQHPLSNAYATSTHTHGNITNDGKIGSTSNLPIVTGDNGTLTTGNTGIAYGQVDNTSTSKVFTATVNGITSLQDGVSVMLRNGVITSAEGFTLNVNGLGAKPVYNSMADATRDTTIFNIAYTMLFVYDSTRIDGGCWICYRGYNSDKDTNTIGYQIRTNSSTYTATDKFVRYRLLLEVDNGHYMPVNTSTSTSATASKSSTINTREFKIGGRIMYYGTTAAVSANTQIAGIAYLWTQINLVLGYSFSNSSSGPSLTTGEPVYMIAKPSTTNKGMAKLNTPYYTQSLPSTADGLIYVYLGQATDATHIELVLNHPIYEYHGSGIRLYRDYYDSSEIDTLLNSKSDTGHTHSNYLTSHQDISGKENTSNKVKSTSSLSSNSTDDQYPSAKLVYNTLVNSYQPKGSYLTSHQDISGKENTSNKSSSISTDTGSTTKYPTVKAVEDYAQPKGNYLTSHQSLTNYIQKSSTSGLLKNDGTIDTNTYLTSLPSHNHDDRYYTETEISNNYVAKSQGTTNNGKFLKVSNGNVTCESVTIPSASSTTPSADISGGAIGTETTWAKADHQHPLSSAYATSGHNHDVKDLNDTTNILTNIAYTSDLTNFLTASDISAVGLSNNYEDLNNLPYLPTATSDFMNDGSGGGEVYIETDSNTNGLIKNDGTIDTTILTHSHGNLSNDGKIGSNANYFVYTTTGGAVTSKQKIGNIDTSGAIGSTSGLPLKTTTNGVITTGAFGTSSGQFAEGNHTHSQYASIEDIPTHLEDLTLSDDEGISSEDGHLLINNQTSGDYIGFADDLLTYDTANSVLNYNTYELATVNDIPTKTNQLTNNSGFLTSHQSLTPTRVYNCTSWNSSYIDTSSSNQLMLYKLGDSLYFLRYFIATKNLVYSTTEYNINSDSIPSDYRPPGDRTFYVGTNIAENARIIVKSTGKVTISASSNNKTIYTAGTLTYWW